jgi:hypothetical protein
MIGLEPAALSCLERTRTVVVNILVAVACGIGASGLILRWRDRTALLRASDGTRQALLGALLVLVAASFVAKRAGAGRRALRDPSRRAARFFRAHLLAAALEALAIPLGLVYGWFVRPRLDGVAPFWVAALALGFLALPRAHELDGFDAPMLDWHRSDPPG